MKVTPSVLVASLSGKAGSTVAGNVRGIGYARRHVIPLNPRTAGQLQQRWHMSRVAKNWRSLSAVFKTFLDVLAAGTKDTGFSLYCRHNVDSVLVPRMPVVIPGNPLLNEIGSNISEAGPTVTKTITVKGLGDPGNLVNAFYILTRPAGAYGVDLGEPDVWTLADTGANLYIDIQTGVLVTVAQAAVLYHVLILAADAMLITDVTEFSGGVPALVTSHP